MVVPYKSFRSKAAAGTVVDYIDDAERSDRRPLRIKRVVICDEISVVTLGQEVGIISGGKRTPIYETGAAGVAGIAVAQEFDVLLSPDDRIYAGFNVATAKDALWLLVLGELEGEV